MIKALFVSGLDDRNYLNVIGSYVPQELTVNGCVHVRPAIRHAEIETDEFLIDDPRTEDRTLPAADVLFNTIANPDRNRLTLDILARICRDTGIPVVNAPVAVLASTRERIHDLAQGLEHLHVPRTVRIYLSKPDAIAEMVRRDLIALPFLIRPLGAHGGRGLVRIDTEDEVRRIVVPEDEYGFYHLSDFIDFAGADGLYRKIRLFAIGGTIMARHMIIGRSWNVHMAIRGEVMTSDPALITEEEAFMADPWGYLGDGVWRDAESLAQRMGLDYMGIDGALMADGRFVVFEANASMNAFQQRYLETFPYLSKPIRDIREATEALLLAKAAQGRK